MEITSLQNEFSFIEVDMENMVIYLRGNDDATKDAFVGFMYSVDGSLDEVENCFNLRSFDLNMPELEYFRDVPVHIKLGISYVLFAGKQYFEWLKNDECPPEVFRGIFFLEFYELKKRALDHKSCPDFFRDWVNKADLNGIAYTWGFKSTFGAPE